MYYRKYFIIIGSKNFFYDKLKERDIDYFNMNEPKFRELIKESDALRIKGQDFEDEKVKRLIISNEDYFGLSDNANNRLVSIIDELTDENSEVYIHNPSEKIKRDIYNMTEQENIELVQEDYGQVFGAENFEEKIVEMKKTIIGQEDAILEISKILWYLSKVGKRNKPYVVMLYGNSSLGKTEMVRMVARKFYSGKYFEKHLSMFQNTTYSDYFFGGKPSSRTIGFDLLERESNLIFLDEIDKCPRQFYSAFYTLFDNNIFKDATYEVENRDTLIFLTSNYRNLEEMKKDMGDPIFYRIDRFIKFKDFSSNTIYKLIIKELDDRIEDYKDICSQDYMYNIVSKKVKANGENARTIKNKIQETIEEILFREALGNHNS